MVFLRRIIEPIRILILHFDLFRQTTKRMVLQKYKGSYLGLVWSFILPLCMLAVYTFVFGTVFQARWEKQLTGNTGEFALTLFVGISIYTVFSEVVASAPTLITGNPNYVKKVIFPVELLSLTSLCSALVQLCFSLVIILLGKAFVIGVFDPMPLLLPVVLIPLIFLLLGISWLLSSIGTYVKDMRQISTLITLIFGYLTPIFYPASLVPENLRVVLYLNPMTYIVENARNVLIYGQWPNWGQLALVAVVCYAFMLVGLLVFKKLKPGFSDVM